ncbi:rCG58623, partial [Rattus norvegicus]
MTISKNIFKVLEGME